METLSSKIKQKALQSGFTACGFARAEALSVEGKRFMEYLSGKKNANLLYLERNPENRIDPTLTFPEAKTVICLLLNYYPSINIPEENNFIISRYAYGKDYHMVLKEKMKVLSDYLMQECGSKDSRTFVDSGPVLEKAWAARAGVGWQGKHSILLNNERGSFHFIGIIITDIDLEYDQPAEDHCGSCTKCIDACPTNALTPYQLDPSMCISNLTINNGLEITPELSSLMNGRIYGCDICQEVCPYNRFAIPTTEPSFSPNPNLVKMRKADWLNLTQEKFDEIFAETPIKRNGYKRFMKNL